MGEIILGFEPNNIETYRLIKKHWPGFNWKTKADIGPDGTLINHRIVFDNYPTTGANPNPSNPRAGDQVPLQKLQEHFERLERGQESELVLDDPDVQRLALKLCRELQAEKRRLKRRNKAPVGRARRLAYGF